MDLHDVARGRGDLASALGSIEAVIQVVGIDTDVLYWPRELRSAVAALRGLGKRAAYREMGSAYGHDAFLVEYGQLGPIVKNLLEGRTA
jgi:homoserine O-acetyltransferase